MKKILLVTCCLLLSARFCWAQQPANSQTLSLRECMDMAVNNNLQVQQTRNSLDISSLQYIQKKFDFLPSVSASMSASKSFGTFVDNFTQDIAESPVTASPNLSASLLLFRGFAKWHELKKAEYDLAAADYTLQDLRNDIRMNVAMAFFQAMFAEENLRIGKLRLQVLEAQLVKVEKEYKAGAKTHGDVLSVRSQLASEKVNVVGLDNQYQQALVNLLLMLDLDPSGDYVLDKPELLPLEALQDPPTARLIFDYARINNPGMKEKEMRILSQEQSVKTSKSAYYPTLSLAYGFGTFYSSNARTINIELVDGQPVATYGDPASMFKQFSSNYGSNLSVSLNVPIFSQFSTRTAFRTAQIQLQNTRLAYEQEENELFKSIVQAEGDVRAARARYFATQEQLASLTETYEYARVRYEEGLMDFYTFIEILDNKTKAEQDLILSQYDYILKLKILDLYQGKPLVF